ncbi:MAG: S9 family peptidase, partial [Gemmatimonadetes bacterium]|nr:S9 family peptidase [Gemmatimonadota bacterium]
ESGAELSPDNRWVLFTAFADSNFDFYYNDNLFVVPAKGGVARNLTEEHGFEVGSAAWSADGRSVYLVANTGVRRELFRLDVEGGGLTQLTRGDHAVGSWAYEPRLDRHVMTIGAPTDPGEVYELGPGDEVPRRVTRVFEGIADRFLLPRQEVVTWAGEDGTQVEGLLFYPLGWREGIRYPLMVQTHGGPASSDRFGFGGSNDYVQKLTALGYMVLQPNYRGSTGYGDAFLRDMVPGYFDEAHRDVMAGVDALIERGLVDGERMAKMGWSAGGHMTNKIITFTDRFRAASSGAGSANWISMYAQSDVRTYRTPWFGGTPWEENAPVEAYLRDSPLFEAHRVSTPTLFLVGQNDPRVPMPQSVEMYRALEYNGVPTHLYVAPREGHGWRELRHRLFKANVELDWFERWVRGREYTWEKAPIESSPPSSPSRLHE